MADDTSVRWALPLEHDELVELQRRSSMVWEEYQDDLLAHPDAIEVPVEPDGSLHIRVAVRDGQLVGFATVVPSSPGVGELDGLFVEPDFMRRGIGRVLIDDAVQNARADGVERIEVTANPRALGFYTRLEFVAVGEVPTRFGPGIRMHLDVRSA